MSYDAVVFDLDGVVVERSPSWIFNEAAEETLAEAGIDEPSEAAYRAIRMPPGELAEPTDWFAREHGVAFADLLARRGELITAKQLEAIRSGEKGTYPDVDAIADLPGPRAVVSNNLHTAVENALTAFGLTGQFDTWRGLKPTPEDLGRKKPDPGYLRQALERLGATDAVYVGDRESDVKAARRAGIDAAFVRRSFNADDELEAEPAYDVDSLYDLVDAIATTGN